MSSARPIEMLRGLFSPFPLLTFALLSTYIALLSVWSDYATLPPNEEPTFDVELDPRVTKYYKQFTDVAVMVFVGFGFLMTFLRFHMWSAVGYTYFIAAMMAPWAILWIGFFEQLVQTGAFHTLEIEFELLINSLFGCASVLIAFGVVIGRVTPLQLLVMGTLHIPGYALNLWLQAFVFESVDIGGSMVIHAYGAYFGVAASLVFSKQSTRGNANMTSSSVSDTFAMIGTLFLWLYWPSFNSALAPADRELRTIINTFLSIIGSTIATFALSYALHGKKFSMVDVQNATLAGGVGVGSAADLVLNPGGALAVGMGAGILSTLGFCLFQPMFLRLIRLQDTCGVHNLHGMPGVYAGVVSVIATAFYNTSPFFLKGAYQPAYQLATLGCSVGIGAVCGTITGTIMRFLPHPKEPFRDEEFWVHEGEEHEGQK